MAIGDAGADCPRDGCGSGCMTGCMKRRGPPGRLAGYRRSAGFSRRSAHHRLCQCKALTRARALFWAPVRHRWRSSVRYRP